MFKPLPRNTVIIIIAIAWILSVVSALVIASALSLGPRGAEGAQGPAGIIGATGLSGPKGDKGDTGAIGATGANGPMGMTGATGPPGANGATWTSGRGLPSSSLGNDGDYYLDLTNSDVYNKESGQWNKIANIQGVGSITYNNTNIGNYMLVNATSIPLDKVANVTFIAPSNGTAYITASATAQFADDDTAVTISLYSNNSLVSHFSMAGAIGGTGTEVHYYPMNSQLAFPVIEGNRYDFTLQAEKLMGGQSVPHSVALWYVTLNVVFM